MTDSNNSSSSSTSSSTSSSSRHTSDAARSLDDELRAALLASKRVAHTLRVLRAIGRAWVGTCDTGKQLCALLVQGAADACALLDVNALLQLDDDSEDLQTLFAHLVELLLRYQPTSSPVTHVMWHQLTTTLDPILPQLIHALDPRVVSTKLSNSVLHVLVDCREMAPWMQQLCIRLVDRGFDPNARNCDNTPILIAAERCNVATIALLQSLGADCGAQRSSDGASILHLLIHFGHYDALLDLFSEGLPLDLFARDHAGQTAAELAARFVAQSDEQNLSVRRLISELLAHQTELFLRNVSPLFRRVLSTHLLPDLASIVVGYIDGSGPAHLGAGAASTATESKENDAE